jgi:hypothetical protein
MDFYITLFFSFFLDNINNNKLHRHNTAQLNLFQKKKGKKKGYCSWEREREP